MKIGNVVTLPVVIIANFANAAVAQDETDLFDLSLEQLLSVRVVSAVSGIEQGLISAPASATVITSQEWQRRGAKTLSQALVEVAGLQTSIKPNAGVKTIIRGLSGSFGQQIKILIDGIPFNRIQDGAKPPLDIPLTGFKRIEIVRSPGSATYGADAFAGIINLVSNDNVKQSTKFTFSAGAFDHYHLATTGATRWHEADVSYAVNYQKSGDDPDKILFADLQSFYDGLFNTTASRAPGRFDQSYEQASVRLKAKWQDWQVSYYGLSGSFGLGAGIAEALDPDGQGKHDSHILDAKYQFNLFAQDETTIELWWQKKYSEFPFTLFPAGAVLPIGQDGNLNFAAPVGLVKFNQGYIGIPSHDSRLGQVNITSVITPNDSHSVRWQLGIEYHKLTPFERKNFGPGVLNGTEGLVSGSLTDVSGTEYAYLPERSRNVLFLSFNDTWQINQHWSVYLGGRYDDYSDFGSTINPRFGIVWQASEHVVLKLLSAKAYRAPSFFDLYAVNNPVNLGNEELNPESINTNELNVSINAMTGVVVDMSYYHYRARDIIEFLDVPELAGRQAYNQGEIEGWGTEWGIRWRASRDLDISANVSYVDNQDGKQMALTGFAKKLATVNVNYKINEPLNVNLFWQYTGKQSRPSNDQRAPLASASWLSSRLSYQLWSEQLEIAFVVNNLLDNDGRTQSDNIVEDYPIAGRQLLLEVNYQF